jgi:hypothetical protein
MASVTLVDTNVLLRLLQPQHFQYSAVTDILTFNRLDFERFPGISVLDPARM